VWPPLCRAPVSRGRLHRTAYDPRSGLVLLLLLLLMLLLLLLQRT
jgi:hypothetical protein